MKKLISIIVIGVMFTSCEEGSFKNKKPSSWVVSKIKIESKTTAIYYVKSTDTTDLNESNTWFADSVRAFQVGDTLKLSKK